MKRKSLLSVSILQYKVYTVLHTEPFTLQESECYFLNAKSQTILFAETVTLTESKNLELCIYFCIVFADTNPYWKSEFVLL